MRIFLHLLLGIIAIIAIVYGVKKLWRDRFPSASGEFDQADNGSDVSDNPDNNEFTDWIKSRNGRVTIIILSLLLLFMALERVVSVGDHTPVNYVPVPSQDVTSPIGSR